MSYDIEMVDADGQVVHVPKHVVGDTYCIGGIDRAELNVTYNYSQLFYIFLDEEKGIRWLYGKTGKECEERLSVAVAKLGTQPYKDYWAPTMGNAGRALWILLQWAKANPDAIFQGD